MSDQIRRTEWYDDQDSEPTANAPDGLRPTGPDLTGPDLPGPVRWMLKLEAASQLDQIQKPVHALAHALVKERQWADLLQGRWLGHSVHPLLTDLPVGAWTSSLILDLVGGRRSRVASERLIAFGVLAAVPTALTGAAEWARTGGGEKRVGFVHAVGNVAAVCLYTASVAARRRNQHARGVLLGVAGGAVASASGHLGGHLSLARRVASRHPAFDRPGSR